MAYSITQFENNATNALQALDNNFTTFGALVPIPCSVAGTNTLTLTQNAAGFVPTPTIAAYTNGMLFTGIAAATNNSVVTAQVGTAPALNVYKDTLSGPSALVAEEITAGNAFSLRYDSALNSGAGGFHLMATTDGTFSPANPSSLQINGNTGVMTSMLSGTVALTFTATPGWSSQDQTFTLAGPAVIPAVGDFVQINPPSLSAAGVAFSGMVTAASASLATIAVRLQNAASASLASNSGVYRYRTVRMTP
jgi:hypothetical protein